MQRLRRSRFGRIAGLDNFCWPDPVESKKPGCGCYKLAQLVRANRALDDVCRAYNLPCISEKHSMKNDATLHGEKISIPPTILFSLIGNHSDVRKAVSSDFKSVASDRVYLCGESSRIGRERTLLHVARANRWRKRHRRPCT